MRRDIVQGMNVVKSLSEGDRMVSIAGRVGTLGGIMRATHQSGPRIQCLCTISTTCRPLRQRQLNPILRCYRRGFSQSPRQYQNEQRVPLPLAGIRVLDLTRVLAGPWCTQLMADMGADVIKIEQPAKPSSSNGSNVIPGGDETRRWRISGESGFWHPDARGNDMSLYFAAVNRNKRSLTLDLKSARGKEVIWRIIRGDDDGSRETKRMGGGRKGADVVINNFLPGTMERLGFGWEEVRKVNPAVVYASVSGYGATGPNAKRAGYDAIALAEAGLLHITGEADRPPSKPGVAIADLCTGLYAYGAIAAALRGREVNGGVGCKIDGSLFESSLSLLINVGLGAINIEGKRGQRFGLGHSSLVPYGGYETKDGRYIYLAANNDVQWAKFCERVQVPGLREDKRFWSNDGRVEYRKTIDEILGKRLKEKALKEWMNIFEGSGLPYGAINDVKEALEHEQATARDMVKPIDFEAARDGVLKMIGPAVKFEGLKVDVYRKPPRLGEHTDEVLEELGYDDGQIEALRKDGVV